MERTRLAEHLLVFRCQVGDPVAFTDLYDRFSGRTRGYLEGLLGYPAADDVQQEVWLTVYRRIAALANPAAFRTWLFQITRNRALDHLRRARRMRELESAVDALAWDEARIDDDAPLEGEDEEITAAVNGLSTIHREVLVLRFWEEMTYPEMALVIGVPVGTVRSRLFHAKRLLRERLEAGRHQAAVGHTCEEEEDR